MTEAVATPVTIPSRSRATVRQAWLDRLSRFATAGVSTAQFCASEGVSVASFYQWKRRLDQPTQPQAADATPRLVPVRLHAAPSPLELVLPSGVVVRVRPDTDPAALAVLLRLLGVSPC